MSLPRIIFDCEPLKNRNSGFSHFVVPLAHELIRQNHRYQLYCYVPPAEVGSLGHAGVRYLTQRSFHKYLNPASYGFRLWHATSQLSWYVPTSPLTKVVLTVHDLNFLHEKADERTYVRQLAMVQRNIRRADYLVTISDYVRQDILHHADLLGYSAATPLRYVRRGVEALAPTPAGHAPAYVPRPAFLFALGTINAKKNFHVLPALLQGNDCELVVAGSFAEPTYVATIRAAAAQAGVADRVTILTSISEADKTWYYQHCQAYLQPSLAEGFGLPVVEAMQLGKPVFLSRLTSLPEVGGPAAYYFDDFSPESMRQVLAAGLARHSPERAATAQAQARHFSWQQAAADYLAVYHEVLGQ
ncbi:glycosyltransferase family 4 protein [Hymenobacter sp. BRD67]|uniref:glycosyltransferase family 4 protein n=1 Tax=Hymenobacter sp. BRD67 TaxID=2675877 RepID=UPI0015667C85|nr:glycosyltransferase family 1 protein [Hymenobacter sp. BRD67]QKG53465.1 glycosyltransferase family 4 protein [Hymenobacter sp. BRD67]